MAKNPKRTARRALERQDGTASLKKTAKLLTRTVAPTITFFLSRATTTIEHKLVKVVAPGQPIRFDSVPHVLIRELIEKKRKVGKRIVTDTHFGPWRPFHNASSVRLQDDCLSLPYVGVKAPLTAWIVSGLLDGLVLPDLPREESHKPRASLPTSYADRKLASALKNVEDNKKVAA